MLRTFDLLKKYDVAGPRYTSYPTVPAWVDTVGCGDYERALQSVKTGETLSLYFHLPFCEKLCHFCGCFKIITKDHSRSRAYVDAVRSEIRAVSHSLPSTVRRVSQIHFGGGTPNFIQPDELSDLMADVRMHFEVLADAEVAIEMHPRTTTQEFCERLAKEGFNRISLGVQDFDERVQKLINRHQTYDMTKDMVERLRALGFKSFNFDLIYGLPGQTTELFARTLELTQTLAPDRLAVYSYAHVPWVSPVQRSFKDEDLPSPETKLKLFEMAHAFFTAHDYHQIGLDHFAKENDELFLAMQNGGLHRNFMGYSTRADAHQIGFGVSSISYVAGNYFQNAKVLDDYVNVVNAQKFSTIRGYTLSKDDHIRRALIAEIMCHMRVDKNKFSAAHQIDFDSYFAADLALLTDFIADELIVISPQEIRVIGNGKLVLRNIAMCFDAHLDDIRRTATNPVFSRTV